MSDLISRQAAIDVLCDNCDNVQAVCAHYPCKQYIALEKLPMENDESVVLLLKPFHGMVEAECSGCGASIYVHPDFVERHRYCFCCGKKIEETVEAIDSDE